MSPFSELRKSVHKLQTASTKLDVEKTEAEKAFRELLDKLPRKSHGCKKSVFRRVVRWINYALEIRPGFPAGEFIKAAKRVQKTNSKLVAFERGFISEGGIKDREWYKHLAVAPGKWLGESFCTTGALQSTYAYL